MSRANLLIITIISLLFFSSCSTVEITGFDKLEYDNERATVYLTLRNPNYFPVTLEELDLTMTIGDYTLDNFDLQNNYIIKPKEESTVQVSCPLEQDLSYIFENIMLSLLAEQGSGLETKGYIKYKVLFVSKKQEINAQLKINENY